MTSFEQFKNKLIKENIIKPSEAANKNHIKKLSIWTTKLKRNQQTTL